MALDKLAKIVTDGFAEQSKFNKQQLKFNTRIEKDVASANKIINNTINNNSAHGYVSAFKWAFNNFYGMKFNTKYIISRPNEIYKFTVRLTNKEISYI